MVNRETGMSTEWGVKHKNASNMLELSDRRMLWDAMELTVSVTNEIWVARWQNEGFALWTPLLRARGRPAKESC